MRVLSAVLLPLLLGGSVCLPIAVEDHIVPVGVCGWKNNRVVCWDSSGKPSPSLTAQIASAKVGVPDDQEGRKGRLLVLNERPEYSSGLNYPSWVEDFRILDFGKGGRQLLFSCHFASERRSTEIQLGFEVPVGPSIDVSFRNEAHGEVNGRRVSIGEVKPVSKSRLLTDAERSERINRGETIPRDSVTPTGRLMWQVPVGAEGLPNEYLTASFEPLDKRGRPIAHVDAFGRPVAVRSGKESFPATFRVEANRSITPAAWTLTNVSPKSIAALRVTLWHTVRQDFGPFFLESTP